MKNKNYNLTKKEYKIFKFIVLNGMNTKQISEKLIIEDTTTITHINAICRKLGYGGKNRLLKLVIDYYIKVLKGVEKMNNCTQCKSSLDCTCQNPKSEYYQDIGRANEYQICREFEDREDVENKKS